MLRVKLMTSTPSLLLINSGQSHHVLHPYSLEMFVSTHRSLYVQNCYVNPNTRVCSRRGFWQLDQICFVCQTGARKQHCGEYRPLLHHNPSTSSSKDYNVRTRFVLTNWLTKPPTLQSTVLQMELVPSSSASQETLCILRKPNVRYRAENSQHLC